MTNYDGIIRMPLDELETFLEQVHLRGLITGGYAVRMGFDWELESNPFHAAWLAETAEPAVDGSNAPYLKALSDAIGRLLVEAVQDEKVSSSIMPPRSMQKYRWKQPEDTGKDLWNEWATQELLLMQQQASAFYAMKQMVNAVLQGEITDPDEIDDILLELSVFRDCHAPAEALWQEVCQQINMRKVQITMNVLMVDDATSNGTSEQIRIYADANNAYEAAASAFQELMTALEETRKVPAFGQKTLFA